MKYFRYLLLLFILMIFPCFALAENTCQEGDVIVKEISLSQSIGNTEEISAPSIERNQIHIDIKMYEVGDSIEYNVLLKNNGKEEYILENNIQSNSEYIDYTIEPKTEHDYKIDGSKEKEFVLKAVYAREVDDDDYRSNIYNASGSPIIIIRDNTFINPETGMLLIFIFFIFLFIAISILPMKKSKIKATFLLFITGVCSILPLYTRATCSMNLELNCDVTIGYVTPNPCTYNGDLVQGAEYTNGQYTYHYKQHMAYVSSSYIWNNIDIDGWGVILTDKESTDPVTSKLCTSINDKPIVSMNYMFKESQATSIDVSSFDTSNVTSMIGMFYLSKIAGDLNLSHFETSNVQYFGSMFTYCFDLVSINMSGFDFSKGGLSASSIGFGTCNALKTMILNRVKLNNYPSLAYLYNNVETIIMNDVDASLSTSMEWMFRQNYVLKNLEISNWDVSNVKSIDRMFYECKCLEEIDISGFNFDSVEDLDYIFGNCLALKKANLSNVVGPQTTAINSVIYNCSSIEELIIDNWRLSTPGHEMFDYTGVTIPYVSAKNWIIPESFDSFGSTNDLYLVETFDVSNWDLSATRSLRRVFYEGYRLKNLIGLDTWDTSHVEDMSYMFYEDYVIEEIDISNFDFSSVTDVSHMFYSSRNLKNIIVGDINAPNLITTNYMFTSNSALESIIIGKVTAPNLTSTNYMFDYNPALKTIDISGFNTTNLSNVSDMFSGCDLLETIYVKSQADITKLNTSATRVPSGVNFVVKTT